METAHGDNAHRENVTKRTKSNQRPGRARRDKKRGGPGRARKEEIDATRNIAHGNSARR